MQYISLINNFNRWLETNPLDPMAQLLMFKFFDIFNRSGWEEWISVDNLTLMSKIRIKREASLITYRDKLIESGLLEYKKGKKGLPNKYRLTFNNEVYPVVQSVVQSEVYPVVQPETQTADNIRQEKDKEKDKDCFYQNRRSFSSPKRPSRGYEPEEDTSIDIAAFEKLGLNIPIILEEDE